MVDNSFVHIEHQSGHPIVLKKNEINNENACFQENFLISGGVNLST